MERLQIREISRLLAQRKHISIGDAERFVSEMFSTISVGLINDKQVIVNGLGTFRQQKTKEKEIVTYVPDMELSETVNAPFANFKTVEITGELSAEDLSELGDSLMDEIASYDEPQKEKVESEVKETTFELGDETANDPAVEQQVEALVEKVDALEEKIEKKRKFRKKLWTFLAVVLLLALIACGGYYEYNRQQDIKEQERIASQKAAELKHKQDSIDNVKRMVNAVDLTDEQKLFLVGKGNTGAPEYPCSTDLETAKNILPRGGYMIVGTLKTVEVNANESLNDIAVANGLGQGEIYIQVHNALENVKEGQKIRIPLLQKK